MTKVLFYVSGHGFGHATRTAEVIRALAVRRPGCAVYLRTTAPQHLFTEPPRAALHFQPVAIDAGVVEAGDALHVDAAATLEQVKSLLRERGRVIDSEAAFIRGEGIRLVVADIPFLAGDIAEAAGVPCLGISNFTWDWIYEPFRGAEPRWRQVLEQIRAGYARMGTLLQLPFGHPVEVFRRVVDVPLIARRSRRAPATVLARLGVDPADPRPRVLFGMRGRLEPATWAAVAEGGPDFLFLSRELVPGTLPDNVRSLTLGPGLSFVDVVSVCSAVVSKLGYSIVSECVANGWAILYPPRPGFREAELFRTQVGRYLRAREIPLHDFEAGHWSGHLRQLLQAGPPRERLATNGAGVCAELIDQVLTGRAAEVR